MVSFMNIFGPWPARLLVFLLATIPCSEAAIAAWWTTIGPQLMLQNTTTGLIRHSACNSYGTPIYSYEDDTYFDSSYKAKNGTALAGVGWWSSTDQQTVYASTS
jgi:hypothetical protein